MESKNVDEILQGITEVVVVHNIKSEIVVEESHLGDPHIEVDSQPEDVTQQEADPLSSSGIGSKSLSKYQVVVLVVNWKLVVKSSVHVDTDIHSPVSIT